MTPPREVAWALFSVRCLDQESSCDHKAMPRRRFTVGTIELDQRILARVARERDNRPIQQRGRVKRGTNGVWSEIWLWMRDIQLHAAGAVAMTWAVLSRIVRVALLRCVLSAMSFRAAGWKRFVRCFSRESRCICCQEQLRNRASIAATHRYPRSESENKCVAHSGADGRGALHGGIFGLELQALHTQAAQFRNELENRCAHEAFILTNASAKSSSMA